MRVRAEWLVSLALLGCSGPAEPAAAPGGTTCEGVSCSLEALLKDAEQQQQPQPWRIRLAESFRVFHYDEALAARVATAAERLRREQLGRWLGGQLPAAWSPRCDVYLFPSRQLMVKLSGGDAKVGSAQSSPSRLYRGRMVSRRMNLTADDGDLFSRTLPHEVAHLVIAALLNQEVPLWAHEGIATLEEPEDTQQRSDQLVAAELAAGRAFPLAALLEMKRYPDHEYTHLFYAQSFSVTRWLIELRGRGVFLEFLRAARPGLGEAALRLHYGMSYRELQTRWARSPGGAAAP